MKKTSALHVKLAGVWPLLDERTRRLMAANEARAWSHGGVSEVSRACGLSRKAIAKGIREIEAGTAVALGRIRQPGAGRKRLTVHDPRLTGRKVTDDEMKHINLDRHKFHGDWNYTIRPRSSRPI